MRVLTTPIEKDSSTHIPGTTALAVDSITMLVTATDATTAHPIVNDCSAQSPVINDTIAAADASNPPATNTTCTSKDGRRKSVISSMTDSAVKLTRKSIVLPILKFHEIFGMYGYAMLVIFSLSTLWTLLLVAIQVQPSAIANSIMNTTNYDDGEFWLLPVNDAYIRVLAIIALFLFAMGYLGLAALMIFPNRLYSVKRTKSKKKKSVTEATTVEGEVDLVAVKLQSAEDSSGFSFARLKNELFYPNGILHHYYVSLVYSQYETIVVTLYRRPHS